MEKLCIFCEYFSFDNDFGGEYAEGAHARCAKGNYKVWSGVYDEDDLREIFLRATNCQDYSPPK